jgi:hypothetical protein
MRISRFILLTIVLISFSCMASAQSQVQGSDTLRNNLHKRNIFTLAFYKQPGKDSMVDFIDGVYRVFKVNKVRDQKEALTKSHLTFIPGVEYSLGTGLAASVNASVLLPKVEGTNNKSSYYSSLKVTHNKQIVSQFATNFWSKNGDYNFNSNWSYLKYPQKDFGLGKNSTLSLFDNFDYSYLKLYQSILKRIAPNLYFGPGVNIDYHWNIIDSTKLSKPLTGFNQYGATKSSNSTGLLLNLLYDTRVNNVNPVANSSFFNIIYRDNIKGLGSDQNWQSIILDFRKYVAFPQGSKNILAFWTYDQLTVQGRPPYLDLPNTASDIYSNYGRGYVQGRFRGDKVLYAESEYRFGITENGFLGGVVFANVQSLSSQPGQPIQGLLPGYGAGLRVKFNKHSNTSVALDYGFGQGGSKGLFMNLGEVF